MEDERSRRGPARAPARGTARVPALITALIAGATVIAGCTAGVDGNGAAPKAAATPAPPAACMLDTAALAVTTGVAWTADPSTASDTRCVYDPAAAPAPTVAASPAGGSGVLPGPDFVAVDVTRFTGDPAAELDTIAEVCETGSRAPGPGNDGFVCRLAGGSVYAGVVRDNRAVTVSASAVPAGTTAARLVVGIGQQLGILK
ncbi:hypothetical protein [Pseudonocardia sp. GCM10023141]|uniref:hypothetical protein n=1 Tax=Pseudonocardia sp. GCM10023141 TaxID=3252653 RepID=UPI003620A3D0